MVDYSADARGGLTWFLVNDVNRDGWWSEIVQHKIKRSRLQLPCNRIRDNPSDPPAAHSGGNRRIRDVHTQLGAGTLDLVLSISTGMI